MLKKFEQKTGLKVEKILEQREIELAKKKQKLIVLKVKGKVSPAFALYSEGKLKKYGLILPCSRYALKDL